MLGNEDFQVIDAKTGEDLTQGILLQIILEEETGGAPMFSPICWPMIRFYGNAMQGMMGKYLRTTSRPLPTCNKTPGSGEVDLR